MTTKSAPTQDPASLHSSPRSETHLSLSDDLAISPPCRRIRVAVGGDLTVTYPDGTVDTIPALLDGESVDVIATKITHATTTASKITIFY